MMPGAHIATRETPPVYGESASRSPVREVGGMLVTFDKHRLEVKLDRRAQSRLHIGWRVMIGVEGFLGLCIAVTTLRYPAGSPNRAMSSWLLVGGYLAVAAPVAFVAMLRIQKAKNPRTVVFEATSRQMLVDGIPICPFEKLKSIYVVQDKDDPGAALSITAVTEDGKRIAIAPIALGFGAGYSTEVAEEISNFTGVDLIREMRDFSPS